MGQSASSEPAQLALDVTREQFDELFDARVTLLLSALDLQCLGSKLNDGNDTSLQPETPIDVLLLAHIFQIDLTKCGAGQPAVEAVLAHLVRAFQYHGELTQSEAKPTLSARQLMAAIALYTKPFVEVDVNALFFAALADPWPRATPEKSEEGSETEKAEPKNDNISLKLKAPTQEDDTVAAKSEKVDWLHFKLATFPPGTTPPVLSRTKWHQILTFFLIMDLARINNVANTELYQWTDRWDEFAAQADKLVLYFALEGDINEHEYHEVVLRFQGMVTDNLRTLFQRALNFRAPGSAPEKGTGPATPVQTGKQPTKPKPFVESRMMTLPLLSYLLFTLNRVGSVDVSLQNMFKLYSADAGFSMRSLELRIFKWQAPTIVIVRGKRVHKHTTRYDKFASEYPRYFLNDDPEANLTAFQRPREVLEYAAVVHEPWKHSNKQNFGDGKEQLVQLAPLFALFKATSSALVYFNNGGMGIGVGANQPINKHGVQKYCPCDVSLVVEANLEYGVFRHLATATSTGSMYATTGGAYKDDSNYEDRFVITDIEVWGVGSTLILDEQRRQWEWEEKMAEARKSINVRNMGEERAFLEMAGIIPQGGHGGGGSM